MEKPLRVFCCYAREDQPLLLMLKKHLRPLEREGLITVQADIDVSPGEEWEKEISQYLNTAQIILLLISPDFMNSDYCYSKEMVQAMRRHKSREASVIPIILSPSIWNNAPFAKLQVLPKDAKPVMGSGWHNQEEAFHNVAVGIAKRAEELLKRSRDSGPPPQPPNITSKQTSITRWYKRPGVIVSVLIVLIIIGGLITYWHSKPPQISCAKRTTNLQGCGPGLGISNISINGKKYTIGLNGDFQKQFDPTNTDEKTIDGLILSQNNEAEKDQYFTIILATLLSKSSSDQFTGLEELRGALLAQQGYNTKHTIKMRLLVANLGIKAIADKSVPIVAGQIALYAANAPQKDHFLGVAGFPFSNTLQFGLPILQENQIPVVGSSPSSDQFSQSPGFHRIESSNSQQEKYLLIFIQEVLHPQKIMILFDSSDNFSTNLGNDLAYKLNNQPNEVPVSSYVGGDKGSIDRAIEPIVSTNPDLLIFTGFPADLNTLKTDMILQGHRVPRILGSQTLYELGAYTYPKPDLPSNYANLIFSSFAFPDESTPSAEEFQQAYSHVFDPNNKFRGVYGKGRAGPNAALSHDAILAILQAVDNLSGNGTIPSMAMVSNELNTLPLFIGATGNIGFLHGSSDPDPATRALEILCTNHSAQTHLLIKYYNNNSAQKVDMSICN